MKPGDRFALLGKWSALIFQRTEHYRHYFVSATGGECSICELAFLRWSRTGVIVQLEDGEAFPPFRVKQKT